ncbi:hypothetical protein FRC06_010765, partial [Ceratobasidium sp. 370]
MPGIAIQFAKTDWPIHLVNCNLGRPITTADYLGAAVHRNYPPVDSQTRRDYGFTQTPRPEDVVMRLGVYTLLIRDLGIKPKIIHKWREDGVLVSARASSMDGSLAINRLSETRRLIEDEGANGDARVDKGKEADEHEEGDEHKEANEARKEANEGEVDKHEHEDEYEYEYEDANEEEDVERDYDDENAEI